MSSSKTKSGRATEDRVAWQPVAQGTLLPTASTSARTDPPVLAAIPDWNAEPSDLDPDDRDDGRVIGQGLSNKLVVGIGVVLIVAAIMPWAFRKVFPKPVVKDLPTWRSDGPAFAGSSAGSGPNAPSARVGTTGEATRMAGGNSPAFLTAQPAGPVGRPAVSPDPPGNPPTGRAGQPAGGQADLRNYPAYSYRDDNANPSPVAGNPLMPSARADGLASPPAAEPGVARLDGRIESPPIRTTFDSDGSRTR